MGVDTSGKALCIMKQYACNVTKPIHLHVAETVHTTLGASLGFVVALAWNDFFKQVFEHFATTMATSRVDSSMIAAAASTTAKYIKDEIGKQIKEAAAIVSKQLKFKAIYAILATCFLFMFNIAYSSMLAKMRNDLQKKIIRKKSDVKKQNEDTRQPTTTN